MSSLSASIKRIGSKTTKKRWRHHNMSTENLIRPQGHVTPKWLIWSSRNSNSSEILWLSWLPASLTKIWSKMNKLAWRYHFPIISLWEIFRRSRAANSIVSGPIWPKVKCLQDFMHVLVTCKYKRIGSKTTEKRWRHRFPYYKSMGAFCCHRIQSFKPVCPKILCNLSPTLMMLHIKFDQHWPTGLRDIQVSSELWQNDRIPEGQGKSNIAPLFQSGAINMFIWVIYRLIWMIAIEKNHAIWYNPEISTWEVGWNKKAY